MKIIPLALMIAPLCGCAAAYPNLATFDLPPPDGSDAVGQILRTAVNLQNEYSANYRATAQWDDYSQLPIIGGAAVAAWILLNQHGNAAKKAGKVGIATTAYSAARGQLMASGISDAYLAGYGALTCIRAQGPTFSGPDARAHKDALDSQITALEDEIMAVGRIRNRTPDPRKLKAQSDALKAAYAIADQAITNARTSESAALKQLAAWNSAPATFLNAVSSVSVTVASKGRVRPAVDFGTLKEAMLPTEAKAAAGQNNFALEGFNLGKRTASDDPSAIIEQLMDATNTLVTSTARLTAVTPDYLSSLSAVQDCPKKM